MKLHTQIFGEPSTQTTLVIAHGLFGSSRNWRAIARQLSRDRQVIALDMRNHGQSPFSDTHSYADMAGDLAEFLAGLDRPADLLGHSMGGKAAMLLALQEPALIQKLIVVDIAPVPYTHSHLDNIQALRAIDLGAISSRKDADTILQADIPNEMTRGFLLQSLNIDLAGHSWSLNLEALETHMSDIVGFPPPKGQFDGPALFLSGGQSDYVTTDHHPRILTHFPQARFEVIEQAAHWVQAEAPREFIKTVQDYLS